MTAREALQKVLTELDTVMNLPEFTSPDCRTPLATKLHAAYVSGFSAATDHVRRALAETPVET